MSVAISDERSRAFDPVRKISISPSEKKDKMAFSQLWISWISSTRRYFEPCMSLNEALT